MERPPSLVGLLWRNSASWTPLTFSLENLQQMDEILFMEAEIQDSGIEQGIEIGRLKSRNEGYNIGYQKGLEIGKEVGFINQFCVYYLGRISDPKAVELLQELLQETLEFKFENNQEFDVHKYLARLKVKFKMLNSMIGTNTRKLDDLSF